MKHALLALLALAPAATAQSPATAPAQASYAERYSILSERNIFVKDRSQKPATRPASSTAPAPRSPEELTLLRGIVLEDDGVWAYIEKLDSLLMTRVTLGDAVARGKVANIDIDAIEYETPTGQRTWISVGSDFTGKAVAGDAPMIAAPTTSASTQPGTPNPNDPNLTIEQQMRLRRQQELRR